MGPCLLGNWSNYCIVVDKNHENKWQCHHYFTNCMPCSGFSKSSWVCPWKGAPSFKTRSKTSKMRTSKSFLLAGKKKRENWVEKEGKWLFICSKTKGRSSKQLKIKHEERHVKRLTPKRGRLGWPTRIRAAQLRAEIWPSWFDWNLMWTSTWLILRITEYNLFRKKTGS